MAFRLDVYLQEILKVITTIDRNYALDVIFDEKPTNQINKQASFTIKKRENSAPSQMLSI